MKRLIIFLLFCLVTLFASPVYAANYYINFDTGNDSTGDGSIGTPWKTISKLNQTLTAGDTGYLRGNEGSYMEYDVGAIDTVAEGIHPDNSGTSSGAKITYSVYPGEMVHLIGNTTYARAIIIEDKNWIHVTGYDGSTDAMDLKVSNMYWFLYLWSTSATGGAGSDYCEIDHIEFTTNCGTTTDHRGSTLYRNSQYNWIHHCSFDTFGYYTTSSNGGCLFELGNEASSTADNTAYNVVEDCKFFHGGHHTFGVHEQYNVIRNNHFHNDQWWYYTSGNQYYGYRNLYMAGGTGSTYHGYNLIEENRISHASGNLHTTNYGGNAIALNQSNCIIRYNDFYANALKAVYIQGGDGTEDCDENHIYNNTMLSNGFLGNYDTASGQNISVDSIRRRPLCIWNASSSGANFASDFQGNVFKNNIMWKNQQGPEGEDQIVCDVIIGPYGDNVGFDACHEGGDPLCGNTIIAGNWDDTDGDPKFTDEGSYSSPSVGASDEWYYGVADCTSTTDPDLTLQSNSPCIDNGTYLTQASGSGDASTALTVDDAKYFQPGWGNGAGGGASVAADYIAIGTVSNTVQISSINYGTNVITLASAKSWSDDASIWLYKDSDGTIVLKGVAPDQGAHEVTPTGAASGTIFPGGCTEGNIDGKTIDVTLVNATWHANLGSDNAQSTAFIDGFNAATSQTNGWNNEIRNVLTYTAVTRVSATVARLTIAIGSYDITENEVITFTAAAATHSEIDNIVATPTFQISAEVIGGESVSATYDATGPSIAYDASGVVITAP